MDFEGINESQRRLLRDLSRTGVPLRPFDMQADIQRIMNSLYSPQDAFEALRSMHDVRREVIDRSGTPESLRNAMIGSIPPRLLSYLFRRSIRPATR